MIPGRVTGLDWAEASVETPAGVVTTRWERDGDAIDVSVTVPWNLTAAVDLPAPATVNGDPPTGAEAVRSVTQSERGIEVCLGPGTHSLRAETDTE